MFRKSIDNQLVVAASCGEPEDICLLLDDGVPIDLPNEDGDTALIVAASWGHLDIVSLLLDRRAAIDHQDHNGDTALIEAARDGELESVRLLLDRGAVIDHKNKLDNTALTEATHEGHSKIVELIVKQVENQKEEIKSFFSGNSSTGFFLPRVVIESVLNPYLELELSPQPRKP